jgi:hypothetical protein
LYCGIYAQSKNCGAREADSDKLITNGCVTCNNGVTVQSSKFKEATYREPAAIAVRSRVGISGRHLPLYGAGLAPLPQNQFSAPLDIFQGAHRSAIFTRHSIFRMYTIIQQNCADGKQKSYKIMRMNMFVVHIRPRRSQT